MPRRCTYRKLQLIPISIFELRALRYVAPVSKVDKLPLLYRAFHSRVCSLDKIECHILGLWTRGRFFPHRINHGNHHNCFCLDVGGSIILVFGFVSLFFWLFSPFFFVWWKSVDQAETMHRTFGFSLSLGLFCTSWLVMKFRVANHVPWRSDRYLIVSSQDGGDASGSYGSSGMSIVGSTETGRLWSSPNKKEGKIS